MLDNCSRIGFESSPNSQSMLELGWWFRFADAVLVRHICTNRIPGRFLSLFLPIALLESDDSVGDCRHKQGLNHRLGSVQTTTRSGLH